MATIKFKAKVQKVLWADSKQIAYLFVKIPKLTRAHCDMPSFRQHPKYRNFANSDLFPSMLARIKHDVGGTRGEIQLDRLRPGVSVDQSGFLAEVTIEV